MNVANEIPGKMNFMDVTEMNNSDKVLYSSSKIIHRECTDSEIQCISVNEGHEVAVAVDSYINIYDSNGKYQFGYFIPTSKYKLISMHSNCIEVYIDIYNAYFTIDKNGNVDNLLYVSDRNRNTKVFRDLLTYANESEWILGETKYNASDIELSQTDGNGIKTTIYKMSETERAYTKANILPIFIIVFLIVCLLLLKFNWNSKE